MVIQIDSREKARAITKIVATFDKYGIRHPVSKLMVGDYMNFDNPRLIVDRKQNLSELCNNVCQQHDRFIREIRRANENEIKLIFLVEHGHGINALEDVELWQNPRKKISPKAVNGPQLHRTLCTIRDRYGVSFEFCDKKDTGKRIIELLEVKPNE